MGMKKHDDKVEEIPLSIGAQLAQRRLAKGLDLAGIAQSTHISKHHLIALENDAIEARLADIFTKGYLRTYADYLGLDADSLVAQYEVLHSSPSTETTVDKPLQSGTEHTFFKFTQKFNSTWASKWLSSDALTLLTFERVRNYILLPLLSICVLAWAYYAIERELPDRGPDVQSQALDGLQPEQMGLLAHVAVDTQVLEAKLPVLQRYQSSLLIENDEVVIERPVAAMTTDEQSVAMGSIVKVKKVPVEESLSQKIAEGMSARNSEPLSPGAAAMVAQYEPLDRLVIRVRENSWIDIRDSEGKRLYMDLARAGEKIDVSGTLPFSLHVGNAPSLSLELNGSPFAITSYRDDNSARLTLASQ